MSRIYLDNAATSWPKPEMVYQAIDRYQRLVGVAAGRGSYRAADEVERTVARCRLAIAKLINAHSPSEIFFTFNCTDALNLGIHGLLAPGDHVVTSAADHNSILRPLHATERLGVHVSTVPVDATGHLQMDVFREQIKRTPTRLIAVTHVSNVTGARQPVEEIAELSKEHGCCLLLDAAQSLGHETIDVQALPVDMLAAPGHKGLLGPLGTGFLYVRESLHAELACVRQGGTGTHSELARQPDSAPEKYEAGNLNVPGIVGLDAGVQFVWDRDFSDSPHLLELTTQLVRSLAAMKGVVLYSAANRFGIVCFNVEGLDPRELATTLDSMGEIQVRAGLHCAPLMHRALGTADSGGAVRASMGHFSKPEQVDTLVQAIEALIADPLT